MNTFNLSDEQKKEILEKHKTATKEHLEKQAAMKGGPAIPEKPKEEKKED